MMAQQGGGGGMPQNPEQAKAQQEQREAAEEQRLDVLRSLLTPDARERCKFCFLFSFLFLLFPSSFLLCLDSSSHPIRRERILKTKIAVPWRVDC